MGLANATSLTPLPFFPCSRTATSNTVCISGGRRGRARFTNALSCHQWGIGGNERGARRETCGEETATHFRRCCDQSRRRDRPSSRDRQTCFAKRNSTTSIARGNRALAGELFPNPRFEWGCYAGRGSSSRNYENAGLGAVVESSGWKLVAYSDGDER